MAVPKPKKDSDTAFARHWLPSWKPAPFLTNAERRDVNAQVSHLSARRRASIDWDLAVFAGAEPPPFGTLSQSIYDAQELLGIESAHRAAQLVKAARLQSHARRCHDAPGPDYWPEPVGGSPRPQPWAGYLDMYPPSTRRGQPVTNEDSSEARNKIA